MHRSCVSASQVQAGRREEVDPHLSAHPSWAARTFGLGSLEARREASAGRARSCTLGVAVVPYRLLHVPRGAKHQRRALCVACVPSYTAADPGRRRCGLGYQVQAALARNSPFGGRPQNRQTAQEQFTTAEATAEATAGTKAWVGRIGVGRSG